MVKKGNVLGYVISNDGIEVDKAIINLINNLPPPTCVKGVRSFLGHARFYCRFIQDFNKIVKLLSSLLAKDVPFQFLEEALTVGPILHSPILGEPFELMCDAFDYAVGVVL